MDKHRIRKTLPQNILFNEIEARTKRETTLWGETISFHK
jgi:hypothetical protein